MECVTSASFSISLNGSLHGKFLGKRGLRQGDPMSPALFLLCMEYLSRLISLRTSTHIFKYHPRCNELKISHLIFADDLMFFAKGETHSIKILIDCLDEFKHVSGLDINSSKSNIFTAGIFGKDLDDILDLVNYPKGTLPVRYLGVPLAAQKLNCVHDAPLHDRIAAYIDKWTANSLSYAGRLLLIKSVLQGIECFWLQIFPLPKSVINRIYKLCRAFLWNKKRHPIAWHDICLPIEEGGLGIRDVYAWNKALLSKILWKFHQGTQSLWVRWIHGFYLRNQSIWTWNPRKDDSTLLKRICDIRDELTLKFGNYQTVIDALTPLVNDNGLNSSKMYDIFRNEGPRHFWHTAIWKQFIPPKFSFCTWLACKDRLSTLDNLSYIDTDPMCKLCKNELESAPHLFFMCPVTNSLWCRIKTWLRITRTMSTLASAIKWIKKDRVDPILKKARSIALCAFVSHIWKARNAFIFDGTPFTEEAIFHKIQKHVYKALYFRFPVDLVKF
ncbi:hypothetical protein DH2020_034579 [Rehmannia glutinosa]|uniref:Reverse transcriptase domain-containing protein n=1 Tax=Rehmannia glutinosa TaxID=99300 RepID=A0ABR0V8Y4_REHGL